MAPEALPKPARRLAPHNRPPAPIEIQDELSELQDNARPLGLKARGMPGKDRVQEAEAPSEVLIGILEPCPRVSGLADRLAPELGRLKGLKAGPPVPASGLQEGQGKVAAVFVAEPFLLVPWDLGKAPPPDFPEATVELRPAKDGAGPGGISPKAVPLG